MAVWETMQVSLKYAMGKFFFIVGSVILYSNEH